MKQETAQDTAAARRDVGEYLDALLNSRKFGPQVVATRTQESSPERYGDVLPELHPSLLEHLQKKGIASLYSHQCEAIGHILDGRDVIVATPTASGKSMIYNLPVVDCLLADPESSALYLFPLKALAQDQLRVFSEFSPLLGERRRSAAIFDGDTSPYARRKIRDDCIPVLLTNPEMLHLSLLPYHGNWTHFFGKLRYVIIDEVHTYRGVFGSHMAWVMRRLRRIAANYGVNPVFIMLSATIRNPEELGTNLTGKTVRVVTESGAPRA